jgi:hypothetical protein
MTGGINPNLSLADQLLLMQQQQQRTGGGGKSIKSYSRPSPQAAAQVVKSGFFVTAPTVLQKMPKPEILNAQSEANRTMQSVMASIVKGADPTRKKTPKEMQDDTEMLEGAMDQMEALLDQILKVPGRDEKGKKDQDPSSMNQEDYLDVFIENMEALFNKMIRHQASPESLAITATIYYERLSKPKYNTQTLSLILRGVQVPKDKAPSPLQSELMYNYFLDITLRYPNELTASFLKPLKSINDYLVTKPKGIPGIFAHLMGIDVEHRGALIDRWITMSAKFPFTVVLPVLLGEEGCAALAQWCWDLYLNTDIPASEDLVRVEALTKGIGAKFRNALQALTRNLNQ